MFSPLRLEIFRFPHWTREYGPCLLDNSLFFSLQNVFQSGILLLRVIPHQLDHISKKRKWSPSESVRFGTKSINYKTAERNTCSLKQPPVCYLSFFINFAAWSRSCIQEMRFSYSISTSRILSRMNQQAGNMLAISKYIIYRTETTRDF